MHYQHASLLLPLTLFLDAICETDTGGRTCSTPAGADRFAYSFRWCSFALDTRCRQE